MDEHMSHGVPSRQQASVRRRWLPPPAARRWSGMVLAVAVIAATPSLFPDPYTQGLVVNFGIDATMALGLVILVGYAGQFSLAQAGFAAIGAYGSAVGTVRLGWPPLLAMVAAALVAAALVYVIGRPVLRLRGHFLAMATLALNEIIYLLLTNSQELGGSSGFGGIPPFSVFGLSFADQSRQVYLVLAVLAIGFWVALRIRNSREGRGLRALRVNETVAAAHGVNAARAKNKGFVLSAVFASIAGSLYAHTLLYVNPSPFGVIQSIEILVIVVIGGVASPWGALLGAGALSLIRESSTNVIPGIFGEGAVGAGEELLVGVLLVLVLVLLPGGIAGTVRRGWTWLTGGARVAAPVALANPPAPPTPAQAAGPAPGRLAVEGLTKRFGGVTAADSIDLSLRDGEILGVIGPNGAGKTTVINLLSGVLPPSGGRIRLDDRDITGEPAHRVAAAGVARTFQTPVMFEGMTVLETVLVGTYPAGHAGVVRSAVPTPGVWREEGQLRAAAERALDWCGLAALRDVPATTLPLGHQKVLEIARGLACEPSVLLLDEPAAGLNRAEKQRLSALLRDLRERGIALLLVEHDMEMVMGLVDRVHVLHFGTTLRVGTPAEVRSDPEVVRAYLGVAEGDGAEGDEAEHGVAEDEEEGAAGAGP